ncbi:MAG: inorganic phosphate transporter [Acidobacteriaceae bacterium]
MATITAPSPKPAGTLFDRKPRSPKYRRTRIVIFSVILLVGVIYVLTKLVSDLSTTHASTIFPYMLLGLALLIALGFEFVNGFHDTANAVASVIYTHSLDPHVAVIWSGIWNFLGVLTSSGAVAFAIVSLLPIELILKVSHGSGFSMVFALLVAAILWNLLTWARGLPASSSHTMIGSILGVGIANQLMHPGSLTSGIDWSELVKIGKALFFSPLVGFTGAFLLLWVMKKFITAPELYQAPVDDQPPPFWIRCLLICTCSGVSFAHGSNDGQKGMGLVMLILVGTVPTAYALNHTVGPDQLFDFVAVSQQVSDTLGHYIRPSATLPGPAGMNSSTTPTASAAELEHFISTRQYSSDTTLALRGMVDKIRAEAEFSGSLGNVPPDDQTNVRNQMYLVSETLGLLEKFGPAGGLHLASADAPILKNYRDKLDRSTKYIPTWVKVAVALALGFGTMFGWRRIVVTVGEKIGGKHLTYAQGACSDIVSMLTILGATQFGLPVSTTHVVSSGVAGTMTANGSGLQFRTIRNIALAWLLTLPTAALLSGSLFWLFNRITR